MIRTSKKPFPVQLPWNKDQTFMVRAGDVIERGEIEADLDELGAAIPFAFQLRDAFEKGVVALLGEGDEAERLKEIVAAEASGEPLSPEDQAGLDQAREAVRKAWPAYRSLLKQQALHRHLAPTLAFQRFVTGWEGEGLPEYARGGDGLPSLELIGKLDEMTVRYVGRECYQALYASADEGNSAPPLPSDKSQAPSTSDKAETDG